MVSSVLQVEAAFCLWVEHRRADWDVLQRSSLPLLGLLQWGEEEQRDTSTANLYTMWIFVKP